MSLELVIQENTNALKDLIAMLGAAGTKAALRGETFGLTGDDLAAKAQAAKAAEPAKVNTTQAAANAAGVGAKVEQPAAAAAAASATLDDAKSAVTILVARKGRDVGIGLLEKHGAPLTDDGKRKATGLPPENYSAFVKEANTLAAA